MAEKKRRYDKQRNGGGTFIKILGILAIVLLLIASAAVLRAVFKLDVLPTNYTMILCAAVVVVILLMFILSRFRKTRIVSIVLSILVSVVLFVGAIYLNSSRKMLDTVTTADVESNIVGVYVMDDAGVDTVQSLPSDAKLGILKNLDRDNTDVAYEELSTEVGNEFELSEYGSAIDLATALEDGKVDAIMINSAYLSLVDESEDLATFESDIKFIWSYEIEAQAKVQVQSEESTEDKTTTMSASMDEPFILYLSGNDTTGTLKEIGRSDVNQLMVINPKTHKILIVNTPRDYYVTLYGINEKDKLTHASVYGIDTSIKTLEALYDIDISYYLRLNFTGFTNIVDALGGITVYSEQAFTSRHGKYTFTKGYNEMTGAEALGFVRERYSFTDGDQQRARNQQAVIEAIIDKITSTAILTNYTSVMNAVTESVKTNVSTDDVTSLIKQQLSDGASWDVETIAAEGTGTRGDCYSMPGWNLYICVPDDDSVASVKEQINEYLKAE